MLIMGLAGWSGSGKTTLLRKLIPALVADGLRVSTIKHAHHGFDVDQPGKDSWLHREAGAAEVLVASGRRWALLHELREEAEPPLPALLGRLAGADLVLVEGFKRDAHPKIEIWRACVGKPLLQPQDPSISAIATDAPICGLPVPALALDDIGAIAAHVLAHARPADRIAWTEQATTDG